MAEAFDKSAYMKAWRAKKELEEPGYLAREREKARIRQAARLEVLSQDPPWVEKKRQQTAECMRRKRADPETRAALNARKRELAQNPEAKRKHAERMKDWKSKNSEKVSAYHKQWREENAEHVSNYAKEYMADYLKDPQVQAQIWERGLWKNYQLTADEFNKMWQAQDGKCLICKVELMPRGRKKNSAAVDHNHQTGAVRGLLCRLCNHGLGAFRDNPNILQSAAKYLEDNGYYGGNAIKG